MMNMLVKTQNYNETSEIQRVQKNYNLEEENMKRKLLAIICTASLFLTGCGKLNNPREEYVISCLEKVDCITDIEAATENHDPNHHLHKKGGYTAAIYFRIEQIELTEEEDKFNEGETKYYLNVDGEKNWLILDEGEDAMSPVDVGTQGGGQIEVYASATDAKNRDKQLSATDGTMFTSGYHVVVGTMVIRTSSLLTASEQEQVANDVITALKAG